HNQDTVAWAEFGSSVPRPRAILAISAHWYIGGLQVTAMEQPRTIHDFAGFPPELFAIGYPAPGSPQVATEVATALSPEAVHLDRSGWGLDHGTWSVLAHMFPAADVPVVQLSLDARQDVAWHIAQARRLNELRTSGVLVVGSGNVVHHLGRLDWSQPDAGFPWAERFDADVRQVLQTDPARIVDLVDHPDFRAAVPSPDHFLPLVYFAGLAAESGALPSTLVSGYAYGSLSMASYRLGG
ncbi:MAG: 4,5-DOPA dioxygenase extradiol, partial [Actinomycetes bacterium]